MGPARRLGHPGSHHDFRYGADHARRLLGLAEVQHGALDASCELMGKYGQAIDRTSAFEQLEEAVERAAEEVKLAVERAALEEEKAELQARQSKEAVKAAAKAERETAQEAKRAERTREKQQEQMMRDIGTLATSILGTFGREATRQITRNLFGCRRR